MELNHLRVFFEVAKVGGFTQAARRLNISQSALSRSVSLLEESEGVKLFERSKKGVSLTPIGIEVFRKTEQLFQTFKEIEGICRGIRETCEGPLKFATPDHVTNDLLVKPLQSFKRQYPDVTASILIGPPDDCCYALLKDDIEFSLLLAKVALPFVDYQALNPQEMTLVCQPQVWKRNRSSSDAKTLKKVLEDVGYIASIGASLQTRPSRVLMELFGELPKISIEVSSQEAQKRICQQGGGVAYLAKFMVEREIETGKLFQIPIEYPHHFNLWVATKKGRTLSLPARTFIDHLRVELAPSK